MKKLIVGLIIAAATATIVVPLALAGGNSTNAHLCQTSWQKLARSENPTSGFNNQDECVSYAAHGGTLVTKVTPTPPVSGPTQVSVPMFGFDASCAVTVPKTPGIDTFLYGVNGHPETEAITGDVTVTGGTDGAANTAPQFWIGYKAKAGYEITNAADAPWHFDFAYC